MTKSTDEIAHKQLFDFDWKSVTIIQNWLYRITTEYIEVHMPNSVLRFHSILKGH